MTKLTLYLVNRVEMKVFRSYKNIVISLCLGLIWAMGVYWFVYVPFSDLLHKTINYILFDRVVLILKQHNAFYLNNVQYVNNALFIKLYHSYEVECQLTNIFEIFQCMYSRRKIKNMQPA